MRRARSVIIGLLALSRPAGSQQRDSTFAVLDAYLRSELTKLRVPGAAVAVVRGDSLVYTLAFGRADETGRPITLETPFIVGSISKSMTAMAIMQLVDVGRIALDTPVVRYLPWFRPTARGGNAARAAQRVTVRQLLNQNSGIPSYAGRMGWAHPDTSDAALARDARRLATVQLSHAPGTTFEYANANYVLLGEMIQEVTRQSYDRYMRERVFAPLGMKHSFASRSEAERDGLSRGYPLWFGRPLSATPSPSVKSNAPAGELIASASDIAHYLSVHLQHGTYRDAVLVSSTSMDQLHQPRVALNDHWSYAMGWMSGTLGRQTLLWHNGLVPNFYAFAAFVPGRNEAIAILTNVGNVFDMPRLNRAAFGALARLWPGDTLSDAAFCPMCPVSPRASESSVAAARPLAVALIVIQCCWIACSAARQRWRSRRANVRSVSLALIWAGLVFFAFPLLAQMPPSVMRDVMPDLAAIVDGSVAIALGWALIRVAVHSMLAEGTRT